MLFIIDVIIIIDAQTEGEKIGDVHIKRMYVNTIIKHSHTNNNNINYLLFTAIYGVNLVQCSLKLSR